MIDLFNKFFSKREEKTLKLKPKIAILDPTFLNKPKMYQHLKKVLGKEGIILTINKWRKDITGENDVIILATSMYKHFREEEKVLGQRNTNRKERLEMIGAMNNTIIPKWAAPKNQTEFLAVAEKWNTKEVVLKYDWSAGRKGVSLLSETNGNFSLPKDFDPEADIIMEHLEEDSYTYKVELMSGVLLNAWVLKTTNIKSEKFNEYTPVPSLFELSEETAIALKEISLKLMEYGVGYASYDMMKKNGVLKLIEVNTNSVGTNISWQNFHEQYARNYPLAILSTLKNIDKIPSLKAANQRIAEWRKKKNS